jgi:hypothetical protein
MYGGDEQIQPKWRSLLNLPPTSHMYLMYLFGYPAERTLTDKRVDVEDTVIPL